MMADAAKAAATNCEFTLAFPQGSVAALEQVHLHPSRHVGAFTGLLARIAWSLKLASDRSRREQAEVLPMSRIQTLLGLIRAWKAKDVDGVLAFMHEDIVWHYAAAIAPPLKGKTKARKFLERLSPQIGEVSWRIFDYAERGDRLFVEGVDEYVSVEGRLVSAPYAGVVEFRDGLIVGLREYFDIGVVTALKAGEDMPEHVRQLIAREAHR